MTSWFSFCWSCSTFCSTSCSTSWSIIIAIGLFIILVVDGIKSPVISKKYISLVLLFLYVYCSDAFILKI